MLIGQCSKRISSNKDFPIHKRERDLICSNRGFTFSFLVHNVRERPYGL